MTMHVRAVRLTVLAFVLALVGLPLGATAASAHAELVSTDPAQGAQVEQAPTAITLRFTEGVEAGERSVRLQDAVGRAVPTGTPRGVEDGRAVTVPLPEPPGKGSYSVVWRVVSQDGHPIAGTFTFGVGVPAGASPVAASTDVAPVATGVSWLRWLAQAAGYAGAAALLGGGAFVLVLWPAGLAVARLRRLVLGGAVLTAASAAVLFLLQGPYATGEGLGGAFSPDLLSATAASAHGRLLLLRMLAVAVTVPLVLPKAPPDEDARPDRTDLLSAVLVAAVLLVTFALSGHAGQEQPPWLTIGGDALHLGAALVWLGGLAVLAFAFLPGADARAAADVLPRWSRTAMSAVAVLVVTGTYQAWRETRSLGALTGTSYGRLVLGKIVLLAVLLLLADAGRRWVRRHAVLPAPSVPAEESAPSAAGPHDEPSPARPAPAEGPRGGAGRRRQVVARVEDGGPAAAPAGQRGPSTATAVAERVAGRPSGAVVGLRESVVAEVVLGVAVLGLTALLVSTVPGRQSYAPDFTASAVARDTEDRTLDVRVEARPARVGAQTLTVTTRAPDGGAPVATSAVTATLEDRAQGLGPVRVTLTPTGTGVAVGRVALPAPGTWTVTLQVSTDALTTYTAVVPSYEVR